MKILITTQNYYPESFLVNDISFRLAAEGHDVSVLTGQPDYSTGEVLPEYQDEAKLEETIRGVKVYRCKIHPRRSGSFHRTWNYLSFALRSNRLAKTLPTDFDLIFCYQTSPVSMADAGIRLGLKYDIPVLLYCLDLWPESLKAWHVSERNLLFKMTKRYSRWIYQSADKVLVSSRPFLQYMASVHEIPAAKSAYLPQYFEDQYASVACSFEDNGVCDFVFAGNVGSVQSVETIVEAAGVLRERGFDRPWRVHILGDGSELEHVKEQIARAGLQEQVLVYGRVPQDQLVEYFRMADVFLLSLLHDNAIGDTLPAKLPGYLCAGKPVIAVAGGASAEIVLEAGCGAVVTPHDLDGLATVMADYCLGLHDLAGEGKRARQYYEANFTYENFHENLFRQIEEVTGASTNVTGENPHE